LPRFNLTYGNKSLWSSALDPEAGKVGYQVEFEWLEAARSWGYPWEAFDALESDTQALIIAHWRSKQRILAVEQEQARLARNGSSRTAARSRRRG